MWILLVPGCLAVGEAPPANASLNRDCLLLLILGTRGCSQGKSGFFPPFLPACVPAGLPNTNRGTLTWAVTQTPLCTGRESSSESQGNREMRPSGFSC